MTDLEKIIAHYGEEAQLNQIVQELGELVTSISKYRNTPTKEITNLIGEIADVENMVAQLKLILTDKYQSSGILEWINLVKEEKIARTLSRIENEKQS
jgi:16S rRNA C1402 N4-methylase RsmH